MMDPWVWVLLAYGGVLLCLLPFAGHRTLLLRLSRRTVAPSRARWASLPSVTIQLPVYNERHVVGRLLDAVGRLDYPKDRLQIQVLDDSTDETTRIARSQVARLRAEGFDVELRHRQDREGFKAGALAAGLAKAKGDLILILDADFVPGADLVRRLVEPMAEPSVGMAQARWAHLNEEESWLTRAQALLLDGHFFFEQGGRFAGGRFFNFNGTAGIWRREALEDAGGWQSDTLTEDLDISYRAQMAGWRFVFLPDVAVPAELPRTVSAFLTQQRRWAQGGIQTARKILPLLLRGSWSPAVKFEAVVHLCGHLAHPLTLALGFLIFPAALARRALGADGWIWLDLLLFAAATAPFLVFYRAAARRRGRRGVEAWARVLATLALGVGASFSVAGAVLRGLMGTRDGFVRTPKLGGAPTSEYLARRRPAEAWVTLAAGTVLTLFVSLAMADGLWGSVPFLGLFATGFLAMGVGGLEDLRLLRFTRSIPSATLPRSPEE